MLDFVSVFIQKLLNFVLVNLFYFFYELCYWLQQAQKLSLRVYHYPPTAALEL